jgi:hypothetical protein
MAVKFDYILGKLRLEDEADATITNLDGGTSSSTYTAVDLSSIDGGDST